MPQSVPDLPAPDFVGCLLFNEPNVGRTQWSRDRSPSCLPSVRGPQHAVQLRFSAARARISSKCIAFDFARITHHTGL